MAGLLDGCQALISGLYHAQVGGQRVSLNETGAHVWARLESQGDLTVPEKMILFLEILVF